MKHFVLSNNKFPETGVSSIFTFLVINRIYGSSYQIILIYIRDIYVLYI